MATRPTDFLWYDLETFGLKPGRHPIAQFGAVRTDSEFRVTEEINILCQMPADLLPDPESVAVHKISPLQLVGEGATRNNALRESEFAERIYSAVNRPGTCSVGYNSIHFDNVYLRYLFYRNLRNPYYHEYKDNCSKWDLLNVLRLISVLKPDAFRLPHKEDGHPSFVLSELARENDIHGIAHDAMEDTRFLCSMAKLVCSNAPELFDFCLGNRFKTNNLNLLKENSPLLHFSSRFRREHHSGSVIYPLVWDPRDGKKMHCLDLRYSPQILLDLSPEEARERIFTPQNELEERGFSRPAIKGVRTNGCPVLHPFEQSWTEDKRNDIFARLGLDRDQTRKYLELAENNKEQLADKVREIFPATPDNQRSPTPTTKVYRSVEERVYGGFWDDEDSAHLSELHGVAGEEGVRLFDERNHRFKDERLNELLIHYKGRNFPRLLNSQEKTTWAEHCQKVKERDLPQIEENLKTLFTENSQDSSLHPLLKETEAYFQQYIYKEDS